MQKLMLLATVVSLGLLTISCAGKSDGSPNSLGGDPNVPIGQVGNTLSLGSIKIGNNYVSPTTSIAVVKNEGGLATLKVEADLSTIPELAKFNALIPASAKNAAGTIDTEVQIRVTSEGIQDFFNKDRAAHTLVKYGASVGDTYALTKSDGKTITRTVVARSEENDFPYGLMNIKTITVEQDSRISGIKKFVYRANHKFGLVHLEVVADDGSSVSTYVYSKNE